MDTLEVFKICKRDLQSLMYPDRDRFNYSIILCKLTSRMFKAIGINEFAQPIQSLEYYLKQTTGIPAVSVNINLTKTPVLGKYIKKSTVINVAETKIGIVGFTGKLQNEHNDDIVLLTQSIQQESQLLKKEQGCHIVIALGAATRPIELYVARIATSVDIIVGGMSEELFYNGKPPSIEVPVGNYPHVVKNLIGNQVLLLHAYAYCKYLGRLNITIEDNTIQSYTGQPIFLSNDVAQDQEAVNLLNQYRPRVMESLNEVVGNSRVALEGGSVCQTRECNMGNLITDALISFNMEKNVYNESYWTKFPIAIYSGNLITESLDLSECCGGNITSYNVYTAIPYSNNVLSFTMKGRELRHALESATGHQVISDPHFLQVSGLRVRYDLNASVGHRLLSLQVRCAKCDVPSYGELDGEAFYKIITNTYVLLRSNVASHFMSSYMNLNQMGYSDQEILTKYLRKMNIVYPEIQGRLEIIHSGTSRFWGYVVPITLIACCLTLPYRQRTV